MGFEGIVKRKRSAPFQPCEKTRLVELVTEHYSIIECKKTDAFNVRARNQEWVNIAEAFNAGNTGVEREWNVLKNLWENLKKNAKRALKKQGQDRFVTEGGPMRIFENDPILEKVIALIGDKVEGFANTCDNDTDIVLENGDTYEIVENYVDCRTHTARTPDVVNDDEDDKLKTSKRSPKKNSQKLLNGNSSSLSIQKLREPHSAVRQNAELDDLEIGTEKQTFEPGTAKTSLHSTARRRQVINQTEADLLAHAKLKALLETEKHSVEEHSINTRILLLREKQEEEKLKQEKIRTELLREELKKRRTRICTK